MVNGFRLRVALLFATLACHSFLGGCLSSDSSDAETPPVIVPEPLRVDCSRGTGGCPVITIAGDPASSIGTFTGFADPGIRQDPAVANRIWMLYSYLDGRRGVSATGDPVGIPHVSTHLARSDDGGSSWRFEANLWDSTLTADPEARGPASYVGSETPSLVAVRDGNDVVWYSVRLAYFLEPVTAYQPRFLTSWTVRIATARSPSPVALKQAPEAVLGTATTSPVYGVHVRLSSLSAELAGCAFWNNPVDGPSERAPLSS